ncbi:MAG: hypothetical protein WC623_24345 [Pedobacter sp.]|uniref:hypothetical protein n=1 Tax=Pedobacter sp. TaxID=1411316 RepID=UPI003566C79D
MKTLILFDTQIHAWLTGESFESAEAHIRNGYPHLLEGWQAGTLKADVIDITEEDAFKSELYKVKDGIICLKTP